MRTNRSADRNACMMLLGRDVLWIVTVVNRINHKLIIIMIPLSKIKKEQKN